MAEAGKPKILFIPAWYPHRYDQMAGLFVKNHALALLPHADVAVLHVVQHPSIKRHLIEEVIEDGIHVYRIYLKSLRLPLFGRLINLWNYAWAGRYAYEQLSLKWGAPDLCHAHVLTRAGWLARHISRKLGIPYLVSEHWSRYFPGNASSYKGWLRKKVTREVVRDATALLPVSSVLQSAMQEHGLMNKNYRLLPNVVDMQQFRIRNTPPGRHTRFISVSCFDEKSKNLKGLLDAFSMMVDEGVQDISLLLVGNGPDRQAIEAYAKQKKLQAFVTFTGELEGEALPGQYQQADALVLSSHYETFATVLVEALACGLPIISTPVGIAPQLLNEPCGRLLQSSNSRELADAMKWMHLHKQDFNRTQLRGIVEQRFSMEEIGRELMQIYQTILKR